MSCPFCHSHIYDNIIYQSGPYFMVQGRIFRFTGKEKRVLEILIAEGFIDDRRLIQIADPRNYRRAISNIRFYLNGTNFTILRVKKKPRSYQLIFRKTPNAESCPAKHSETLRP